jgi:hypothetical protein
MASRDLRWRSDGLAATITDNNETAVSGPFVKIVVDQIPVGTYQISRRLGANGFRSVTADISGADRERPMSVISVGGAMQFVTNTFTYSASLEGAAQGLQNLKACSIEASQLDAAPASTARSTQTTPR